MTQLTYPARPAANKSTAPTIELFDPPMCCSTGLCGPAIDQTLVDVNEMVMALQAEGMRVERYQLSTHPQSFLGNPAVMQLVREHALGALPITVVRGKLIKHGAYPTMNEIRSALNGG